MSEQLSATVVPRSSSGLSLFDSYDPPPPDLTPYRAAPETLAQIRSTFEGMGFRVFDSSLGLTLTITGPPELFAQVFDVPVTAREGVLAPPESLRTLIERVSFIPPPFRASH